MGSSERSLSSSAVSLTKLSMSGAVASYETLLCERRLACAVWAVSLPCSHTPLARLPHRAGCWARPTMNGCNAPQPKAAHRLAATFAATQLRNWTRVRSAKNISMCLSQGTRVALQAVCSRGHGGEATGEAAAASRSSWSSKWHTRPPPVDVAFISRDAQTRHSTAVAATSSCLAIEPAMAFQVPRRGTCVTAGAEPAWPRYLLNHGHQAEIVIPIVDEAVMRGYAPEVIHWGWRRAHWTSEVLRVMLPFTRLQAGRLPSKACRTNRPIGTGGGGRHWLRAPITSMLMRRAMRRHCGLRERFSLSPGESASSNGNDTGSVAMRAAGAHRASSRLRVVVLLRGDSQQVTLPPPPPTVVYGSAPAPGRPSGAASNASERMDVAGMGAMVQSASTATIALERRPFANLTAVLRSLRAALPGARVRIASTSGRAPICEQAKWVHSASVVVSPHGAHLTNALWMAHGSLLVEVCAPSGALLAPQPD